MKTFKRALSCFLALLMIFGSFSVLSYATLGDGNTNSLVVETKFFVGGNEVKTVKAGDKVEARVFIETDYKIGATALFWVYPSAFLEFDNTGLVDKSGGYDAAGVFNKSATSVPATANLGGVIYQEVGVEIDSYTAADNLIYDGYLEEEFFDDKGWITLQINAGTPAVLTSDEYLASFNFTVKKDASVDDEGYFYIPEASIKTPQTKDAFTAVQRATGTAFGAVANSRTNEYDWTLNDKNTISLEEVGDPNSIVVETKFFVGGNEVKTVKAGDTVEARVHIGTDFKIGATALFWVYPSAFLEFDNTGLVDKSGGYDAAGVFNKGEKSVPVTANFGGVIYQEVGVEIDSYTAADNLIYDGYLEEEFFDDKGWMTLQINAGTPAVLNINEYLVSFRFTVKSDASVDDEGYFYIPEASIKTPQTKDAFTAVQRATGTAFGAVANSRTNEYDWTLNDTNTISLAAPEEPTTYELKYVYAGDVPAGYTAPEAIQLEEGADIAEPEVTIPAGYTLTWATEGDVDGKMGTEAVTMTGTWAKVEYDVTYSFANEGPEGVDAPAAGKTTVGATIAAPSTVAPAGWTLTWAVEGATEADGSYIAGANDVTFVGTWAKVEYDVTYSFANEGPEGVDAPAAGKTTVGATIAAPSTVAPAGWTLTWAVEGATEADGSYIAGANDVTFVGTWAKVDYAVTYVYAGEVPAGLEVPEATTANIGDAIVIPEVSADGYTVAWTMEGDADGKMGTAPVTVTGTWAKNEYTITYYLSEQDKADGKVYDTKNVKFGDAIPVVTPEVEGKTFNQWDYETEAGVFEDDFDTMPAYNLIAIANLSDIIYTVTFTNIWGDEITVEKDYGEALTEDDIPDLTDGEDVNVVLTYNGIALDEQLPLALTEDIAIDCAFKVDVVFYTEYDEENPENNVVYETYTFDFEHETTEEDFADLGTPKKKGHSLDADLPWTWEYVEQTMFANTYFVANWVPNDYTATFTAGEGAFAEGVETTVDVTFGEIIEFTAEPALEGYTFTGWTDVEGGAVLDELVMDEEGKTFYPVFIANGQVAYTVEIYLMDETGAYATTASKKETGSAVFGTTVTVAHADYAQDAWFSADTDAANEFSKVVAEDGSTVLKLYYARAQYDVVIDGAAAVKVYHGATVTAPTESANTPAGYVLESWNDGAIAKGEKITVTGPITLTPDFAAGTSIYTIKTYTMGLDGEYGEAAAETFEAATDTTATYTAPAVTGFTADKESYSVVVTGDGKAVIEVYYARDKYDVTIDGVTEKVFYGAEVTAPTESANTPEGYVLESWNDGAIAKGEKITVTGPLTLTPDFIANDATAYTVEIYLMDAEGNYAETASDTETGFGKTGEIVTIAHADYAQADYYLADDAQANVLTGTIAGDGSLVLKLYFKRATYDVVVDGEIVAEDVIHGAEVTLPETSDNIDEGNELAGWTDGKNTYEPGETIVVEGDLDLTPVQKPSDATEYTISIYVMDTNGEYVGTSTVAYGTTGAVQTIVPDYGREGFTVDTEKSNLSDTIAGDGSTVLSVYYARNTYKATFDGVEYEVYYGASLPTVEPEAQEGKEFAAWTPELPAAMPAEDLEFTSTWTDVMYKLIYIINGTEEEYEYAAGATVTPIENPTVPGMTFVKWNKEIPTTMPAEDVIIVAEFEAAVFKVTFLDADGKVFDEKAVKCGDTIVLPATNPTKEYNVFKGWDGIPEDGMMPAYDLTIYPIFERVPVRLVAAEGSTTVIDRDTMIITGLTTKMDTAMSEDYLAVEGDGYYTLTAVGNYSRFGTGAMVEVWDNADTSAPIETFYIVIYGDVNGDSAVNSLDGSIVQSEALYDTNWSRNDTVDALKVMAADLVKDGKIKNADADIIYNTALGITSIDQATGTVVR